MLDGCARGDLISCREQARSVLRGLHTALGVPLCLASAIAVRCLLVLRAAMTRTTNAGLEEAAEARLLRQALRLSLGPVGATEVESSLAPGRSRGRITTVAPGAAGGRKRRRTSVSGSAGDGDRDLAEDLGASGGPSPILVGPELEALIRAVTGFTD
jgi:hypothetical protein